MICKICGVLIRSSDIVIEILEEPSFPVGKFVGSGEIIFYHSGDICMRNVIEWVTRRSWVVT